MSILFSLKWFWSVWKPLLQIYWINQMRISQNWCFLFYCSKSNLNDKKAWRLVSKRKNLKNSFLAYTAFRCGVEYTHLGYLNFFTFHCSWWILTKCEENINFLTSFSLAGGNRENSVLKPLSSVMFTDVSQMRQELFTNIFISFCIKMKLEKY